MGIFDRSAFPEDLDTQEEVDANFKDDDQLGLFGKLRKKIKHWDTFGPRSPKGIAFCHWPPFILARQWRDVPKVLWAEKWDGAWRFEADGKPDMHSFDDDPKEFLEQHPGYYLSRVQLWCRRHKAIQWPLFFSFHAYKNSKDVLQVGTKEDRDGKIQNFYFGAKRDAQRLFRWVAIFAGENFK